MATKEEWSEIDAAREVWGSLELQVRAARAAGRSEDCTELVFQRDAARSRVKALRKAAGLWPVSAPLYHAAWEKKP